MALPVRIERQQFTDPFELVRHDLGTLMSRFFEGGLRGEIENGGLTALAGHGVDIREDEDHIMIEADLPGFKKDEVNVSIDNGILTISAEHKEEIGTQHQGQSQQRKQQSNQGGNGKGEYLLRERRYHRFIRSFTLPANVDEQNVNASLQDGVLKITLRKLQESKPKKIAVS